MFLRCLVFTYFTILCITPAAKAQETPWTAYQVEMAMADRLQERVLDRILGRGKSSVFVSMDIEFSSSEESSSRDGVGSVEKVISSARAQKASQRKASRDSKLTVRRGVKRLSARVLYDQRIDRKRVMAAIEAMNSALEPHSKDADIVFLPAPFL